MGCLLILQASILGDVLRLFKTAATVTVAGSYSA